jgi:hypothetical protein
VTWLDRLTAWLHRRHVSFFLAGAALLVLITICGY